MNVYWKRNIEIQSSIWQKYPVSFCWLETSWLVSESVSEMPRDGYHILNISMSIGRPARLKNLAIILHRKPPLYQCFLASFDVTENLCFNEMNNFKSKVTVRRNLKRGIITFLKIWFRFICLKKVWNVVRWWRWDA